MVSAYPLMPVLATWTRSLFPFTMTVVGTIIRIILIALRYIGALGVQTLRFFLLLLHLVYTRYFFYKVTDLNWLHEARLS